MSLIRRKRIVERDDGVGTYTARVWLGPGSVILDVLFKNKSLWGATTAVMKCGLKDPDDAVIDDDCFFTNVNVKSAPAVDDAAGAGGISALLEDTGSGASKGLYTLLRDGGVVEMVITTTGTPTDDGESDLIVIYDRPGAGTAKFVEA